MIVSVSRRTDVPALYLDWFLGRLESGEVLVRNPMRPGQVSRVDLSPEAADGIVFWSKAPGPLLSALGRLERYPFYLLYTLNPYGADMEGDLPEEEARLDVFRELSAALGPERVIWRYDPIVVTPRYSFAWHEDNFARLAGELRGAAAECKTSFYHPYAKTRKAMSAAGAAIPSPEEKTQLALRLRAVAEGVGIALVACCDPAMAAAGLAPAACVDAQRMGRIAGRPLSRKKDSGQRPNCTCSASVDIGTYDTCTHGCRYCYANHSPEKAAFNRAAHDPRGRLLCGGLREGDTVGERDGSKGSENGRLF